jgi:hypothetical protein
MKTLLGSIAGWGVNVAIALTALRTNLMRSILTTLGVMIGCSRSSSRSQSETARRFQ